MWELLILVVPLVAASIPAYITGTRTHIAGSGLAFIPLAGPMIVLLRVIGQSGWLAFLLIPTVFVPPLGFLALQIWFAIAIPQRHNRSGWWIAALILVPVISWWVYALTMRESMSGSDTAAANSIESPRPSPEPPSAASAAASPPPPPPPPLSLPPESASSESVISQLERLTALKNQGVLSAAEFEDQKRRILTTEAM